MEIPMAVKVLVDLQIRPLLPPVSDHLGGSSMVGSLERIYTTFPRISWLFPHFDGSTFSQIAIKSSYLNYIFRDTSSWETSRSTIGLLFE